MLPLSQLALSRASYQTAKRVPASADRKIGLPLRTGSRIGVQLERRAKGHATIGGANVEHVAGVGAGSVLES